MNLNTSYSLMLGKIRLEITALEYFLAIRMMIRRKKKKSANLCCPLVDEVKNMAEMIFTALKRMGFDWSDIILLVEGGNNLNSVCPALATLINKPIISPTFMNGLVKITRYDIQRNKFQY